MFVLTVIFEHHRLSITNVPMATFFCSPYNLLYRNLSDFVLESIFIYGIVVGYKDPSYTAKYISRKRVLLTLPCSNSKPNSTIKDTSTILIVNSLQRFHRSDATRLLCSRNRQSI